MMRKVLHALIAAGFASCMILSVPADAGRRDKPKGDHPERHCKPEKHQCATPGSDDEDQGYWDWEDDYDNSVGDRPDPKCVKKWSSCPVGD